MSDAAIKGSTATDISFKLHFAIPQATYKLTPTGGVTNPMARLTIITTPKCTKSIPKLFATGTKSGTNIYNADVESKKQPAIKSITFTIIKNMILFPPVILINASLIATSILDLVNIYAKILAAAVINITVAVVDAESTNIL